MPEYYVFVRTVTPADWSALPRAFKAGETVRRSHDMWGLCRDDATMGGFTSTVPCTLGETVEMSGIKIEKMFTVPCVMLRTPDGKPVHGDYG